MRVSEASRVGVAGLLSLVATYGIGRLAYGLFVPRFQDEFGLSLDVLGYFASGAQAGYLVATVLTGIATARYGPRLPVVTGCLVLAAGAATIASAPGPVLLAVGLIAVGASAGGTWAPFSDAVEQQVPASGSRRALALVNAGSPFGLVVASGLLVVTGDRWRVAWWGFAGVGLLSAATAWRVLRPANGGPTAGRGRPSLGWFINGRSLRLFVIALGLAITSGAYLSYAPETALDAGMETGIGQMMWTALGVTGAAVGAFGGDLAGRYGLRWPLSTALALAGGSTLVLLVAPDSTTAVLASAALFGVGFTIGFALVVIWSQELFHDRPTTGFTLALVVIAAGFIVGPSLFGVLATRASTGVALVAVAAPALVSALVLAVPGGDPHGRGSSSRSSVGRRSVASSGRSEPSRSAASPGSAPGGVAWSARSTGGGGGGPSGSTGSGSSPGHGGSSDSSTRRGRLPWS